MSSVKVRTDKGRLLLDFEYKGVRCREYIGINNNKQNRRYAERLAAEIEQKILLGTFDYAEYFPNSKRLKLFGIITKKNYTFKEYAKICLERMWKRYESGEITAKTLTSYETCFFEIANGVIGNKKLTNITIKDLEDFRTELLLSPKKTNIKKRSAKTVNNLLIFVRYILKSAFQEGLLKNYLTVSDLKKEKPEIYPFDREEVNSILEYINKKYNEYYCFFVLGFFLGLRIEELLALKWEDIDWQRDEIFIRRVVRRVKNGYELSDKLKTVNSKRILRFGNFVKSALTNHKQYTYLHPTGLLFVNKKTNSFYHDSKNIIKLVWKPTLKKLGLIYRDLREMRHTFAVLSLIAGDNPHDVAKRMGHTSLQMLFQRYARFIPGYYSNSKIENFILSENCQNSKQENL